MCSEIFILIQNIEGFNVRCCWFLTNESKIRSSEIISGFNFPSSTISGSLTSWAHQILNLLLRDARLSRLRPQHEVSCDCFQRSSVSDQFRLWGSLYCWLSHGDQVTTRGLRMAAVSPGLMMIRPLSLTGGWRRGKKIMFARQRLFCHLEANYAKLLGVSRKPNRNDGSICCCAFKWHVR